MAERTTTFHACNIDVQGSRRERISLFYLHVWLRLPMPRTRQR